MGVGKQVIFDLGFAIEKKDRDFSSRLFLNIEHAHGTPIEH
jgi:hypothetical protein